jgi:small-conductance mechanosensitive channel
MSFPLLGHLQSTILDPSGFGGRLLRLVDDWGDDTFDFLRHDAPRIVGVLIVAFILTRLLKAASRHLADLSSRDGLPSGVRSQQFRTLSSVTYSVGFFIVFFWAAMAILQRLGINVAPLLASAGVAGLAVGFGAQTLVKDFINGFFILVENQYDIGDTVKIAGVTGSVEVMTLRRTVLRGDDGALYTVPSSQITIVSNLTRDWAQLAMHVSVAYGVDSDQVVQLLKEIAEEVATDPQFADRIVGKPEVPGIDKITGNEVEYLLLVKTKPGAQYPISRELRRRIKAAFEKNHIEPGNPNRMYVVDTPK